MSVASTGIDLSIVVPCYNEAPHLAEGTRALLDVLEQTRYAYEVVFVDDCSTDETRAIILRLCGEHPHCRYVFHEHNRGRGGAFKTGFANTSGRVTGFLDIDLEVSAHYIPALVNQIDKHGADVATGYRHYLLRQTGAFHRHVLSVAYRALLKILMDAGVRDTETGCKVFRRDSAGPSVLGSECDGWFWDTEVMARARLANLKVVELPVLFLRRYDKQSTVRLLPDTWQYLVELYRFRPKVGLSLANKSPIYWTGTGYDFLMRALYQGAYEATYRRVADKVPAGASVVDLCCGTGSLYRHGLAGRAGSYLGLDFNGHFVLGARKRGVPARFFNILSDEIPRADYVVMCSSFYHVRGQAEAVLAKMRAAAKQAVIISEPVSNLSLTLPRALGKLAAALTNPGVGDYEARYDRATFEAFARANGASEFQCAPEDRNAIATFPGQG
jgi:glycosyltransferase involved in cell wall biosynthesis